MKKILTLILTILWVWFSFCSADWIYHNSDLWLISIVINWNTKYTLKDKNEGATCTDSFSSCSYWNFYSYDWNNICPSWYSWFPFPPDPSFSPYFNWTSTWILYDLSSIWLNVSNWIDIRKYLLMPFAWSQYHSAGEWWIYRTNFPTSTNYIWFFRFSDTQEYFSYDNFGMSVRCFKNSVVDPNSSWSVLYWDELGPSSPIFKVYYWNTSYEYELEDNLSIYLKSPVAQSWYTFTYAWSTWINLYFNNTSQFYNKDKMYLKTPSWYNNFVFTPVCL